MNRIKEQLAQFQATLATMKSTQKWLIGCLFVIMIGVIFVISLYSTKEDMVSLANLTEIPDRSALVSYLDGAGIKYKIMGGSINVERDKHNEALSYILMNGMLGANTSKAFESLMMSNNWWDGNEKSRRAYDIALQNVLSSILQASDWVGRATVVISRPQQRGFGVNYKKHSATVHIHLKSGTLSQARVDGVASMVSGAVAELNAEDVVVFDGATGRKHQIRNDDDLMPVEYLAFKMKTEEQIREKIMRLLNIPELMVEVNAEVDLTRSKTDTKSFIKEKSGTLVKSESNEEDNTENRTDSGEPGARSNTSGTIAGINTGGTKQSSTKTDTQFDTFPGHVTETAVNMPGETTRIDASINVPRSFFVQIFKNEQGENATEPTDQALQPLIETKMKQIEDLVTPMTKAKQPGTVQLAMYYDTILSKREAGAGVEAGVGGSFWKSEGLTVSLLSGVTLLSFGFLFMLLKSSDKQVKLPSVEELAGIPPHLASDEELIGEALESRSVMTGMELDESQVRNRQVIDQISAMLEDSPGDVANVVEHIAKSDEQ